MWDVVGGAHSHPAMTQTSVQRLELPRAVAKRRGEGQWVRPQQGMGNGVCLHHILATKLSLGALYVISQSQE